MALAATAGVARPGRDGASWTCISAVMLALSLLPGAASGATLSLFSDDACAGTPFNDYLLPAGADFWESWCVKGVQQVSSEQPFAPLEVEEPRPPAERSSSPQVGDMSVSCSTAGLAIKWRPDDSGAPKDACAGVPPRTETGEGERTLEYRRLGRWLPPPPQETSESLLVAVVPADGLGDLAAGRCISVSRGGGGGERLHIAFAQLGVVAGLRLPRVAADGACVPSSAPSGGEPVAAAGAPTRRAKAASAGSSSSGGCESDNGWPPEPTEKPAGPGTKVGAGLLFGFMGAFLLTVMVLLVMNRMGRFQ